ncbi:hypothetical protein HO173_001437 [Letharia columbiana]|uniref:Transmembrane protein n=1 Tax=Letharia columbiana TaxID=112416 RepID=A0A8H6G530_9LECA|nr:uncharacterized protein HO173_001437 [Letharia columbiana]KAF6240764.1 hypothetical protein HO173_001437 [Letharia columbiana]
MKSTPHRSKSNMSPTKPTMAPNPPTRESNTDLLDEVHQRIDDFTNRLLALCIQVFSFIALLAKWVWIGLALWWRCAVVLLFALLVVLGVNVLSLSLMSICARYVYNWVVNLQREQERDRFWAVRGLRRRRRGVR